MVRLLVSLPITVADHSEQLVLCLFNPCFKSNTHGLLLAKHCQVFPFFYAFIAFPRITVFSLCGRSWRGIGRETLRGIIDLPLLRSFLSKMCKVTTEVCSSAYESILFTSVFSLFCFCLFFEAFRVSEILPASKASKGIFLLSNVLLGNRELRLFLRISKMDPHGFGDLD